MGEESFDLSEAFADSLRVEGGEVVKGEGEKGFHCLFFLFVCLFVCVLFCLGVKDFSVLESWRVWKVVENENKNVNGARQGRDWGYLKMDKVKKKRIG